MLVMLVSVIIFTGTYVLLCHMWQDNVNATGFTVIIILSSLDGTLFDISGKLDQLLKRK